MSGNLIFPTISLEEHVCGYRIELGTSVKDLMTGKTFENTLSNYSERNFAIVPDTLSKTIYVIYKSEIRPDELLESYAQAVLAAMLASGHTVRTA